MKIDRRVGQSAERITDFYVMLKTKSCGAAVKSDFCPCSDEWYIVGLCQCRQCDKINSGKYIGLPSGFPETYPSTGNPHAAALQAMYDINGNQIHRIGIGDNMISENVQGPTDAYIQDTICTVQHNTRPAPFDCGITAKLYLRGKLIQGTNSETLTLLEEIASPIPCLKGGRKWLGCDQFYTTKYPETRELLESNCWGVFHKIVESGAYNMDLVVTMTPDNPLDGDTYIYTIRVPMRISDAPDNAPVHSVLIMPSYMVNDDGSECPFVGYYELTDRYVSMETQILKGPFKTKEMAQSVYENGTFGPLIDIYAESCACPTPNCDFGHYLGYQFWVEDEDPSSPTFGMWKLEGFGGVGDPHSGAGCDSGSVEYEVNVGTEIVLIREDGSSALASGVLAPCEHWSAFSKTEPDPDDPNSEEKWGFGGDHWAFGRSATPCPFCSARSWDFDTHTWIDPPGPATTPCLYVDETFVDGLTTHFSDWYYTARKDGGPYGIPANTEEYNDWTGEVLIASASDTLLSELPERLV